MSKEIIDSFFNVYTNPTEGLGVYCSLDTMEGNRCFGHWVVECAIFLPYIKILKKEYPDLKVILGEEKRYKKNILYDFDILKDSILYKNITHTDSEKTFETYLIPKTYTLFFKPKFQYMAQVTIQNTLFFKALDDFRSHYSYSLIRPKTIECVYIPFSKLENYGDDNKPKRPYKKNNDIHDLCLKNNIFILNIDTFNSFQEQIDIILKSKVIICDSGSAFTVNVGLFSHDATVLLLNARHLQNLGSQTQALLNHLNSNSSNKIIHINMIYNEGLEVDINDLQNKIDTYVKPSS